MLTGPHMENFADILQQLRSQSRVSESLRSVGTPEELVAVLQFRFKGLDGRSVVDATSTSVLSNPSTDRRTELTRAMSDLAVSTLSLHELRLISWLANDDYR